MNRVEIEGKIISVEKVTGEPCFTIEFSNDGLSGYSRYLVWDIEHKLEPAEGHTVIVTGSISTDDNDNPLIVERDMKEV